jgi:beta-lactamase class A
VQDFFAAARTELDRTRGVTGVMVREVSAAAGVPAREDSDRTLFSQRPDEVFPAASVIKIPLVMALYADAAEGRLSLEERVPVGTTVSGTGILGDLRDVADVSLRDLAMLTIALSDNTATNRLIERVGVARVEERLAEWGCTRTKLARGMFDWDAQRRGLENLAAPSEVVALLERLVCGELVDRATSDAVIAVLERCQDDAMLRRYLGTGFRVANKTGMLAATRNDAAIVFGPSRTVVVAAFMREVEDPLAAVHILGLIGRGAARAAGLEVPPLPFDAAAGA